ncbi:MAG: 2-hydroxyacid dehydrogenase [Lachnospiraceae bacterium]|nr:2-hydroxyacid dehydrogenase [Lachnospiraceae bacterium]
MKILFYDTKSYDEKFFREALANFHGIEIEFTRSDLDIRTASLAQGFDAVCAFVSSDVSAPVLTILHRQGIRLVLMRCAGYNNVDLKAAAEYDIRIMRVPGYSPEAVAEHAMALALASNRRIHKAYNKVRENDFSLNGLMGFNFYGKTAGIIGTGKIGAAMCRICHGFGMKVIAYDVYENPSLKNNVEYVSLEQLLAESDLISLHCPLTDSTYHIINIDTIKKMKDGVILVNTSRGALVNTEDLIEGIRLPKFSGVGLDVYEEETRNVFEDRSDEILEHSTTARLLSFPHVVITSHQGFFTREALSAIADTTLLNAMDALAGKPSANDVTHSS